MTQNKICPIDKKQCNIAWNKHDLGEWRSAQCRHGGWSEEDNTMPSCALRNLSEDYIDRKKKSLKPKTKRCRCKK